MSATTRSSLSLTATTSLSPAEALDAVKVATTHVKGGGASLLTTGLQNAGAQVNVERHSDSTMALSISSGRRLIELCTFSATTSAQDGGTTIRVGGLDTYRTTQSTVLGFIPVGPKMIAGMAPYKRFLDEVGEALRRADPAVRVSIAERA
jgi:hypothetical protein